jgi:hypothetical protein
VLWRDDRRKKLGEAFQGLKPRVAGSFMSRPACGGQAKAASDEAASDGLGDELAGDILALVLGQ